MNLMKNTPSRRLALSAAVLTVLGCTATRAEVYLYNVSIPTDELNANGAEGPFSMLLELSSVTGTGDNTVTLTDFNTGPAGPVTLTDNEPLVYDIEGFTPIPSPGSTLSFDLSTTNNSDPSGTPDEFSFYILDASSVPITTTDQLSSSLFTVDLGGDSPTVTTFESLDGYTGVNPTITPYTIVPEPSDVTLLLMGMIGVSGLIVKRRRYCIVSTRV